MTIEEILKPLIDAGLFVKTGCDWDITIHMSLTEPTCPTVVIRKEESNSTRYRFDRDSIEDGVRAAVNAVLREVIDGEKIEPECPFTNPDDR